MFQRQNIFDFQKALPADIVALQGFVQGYNDTLFRNAISRGKWWTEFSLTKGAQPFEVIAGNGQIWIGGLGYANLTSGGTSLNMAVDAPAENGRIMAIVAARKQDDTNPEQREFLRTTENGQRVVEGRDVSTVNFRQAIVSYVPGEEAPSPQRPIVTSDGAVVIGWVELTPSGIKDNGIVLNLAGLLPSIDSLYAAATANGSRLDLIAPRVANLESDLAGLRADISTKASNERFASLSENVAVLNEQNDLPDVFVDYGADSYVDTLESDTTYPGYYAKIEDGLRFPTALFQEIKPIAPPRIGLDARIYKHESGLILPAWEDSRNRFSSISGFLLMNAGVFDDASQFVLSMSPNRARFGQEFEISAASDFWANGRYTAQKQGFFTFNDGRSYQVYPTSRVDDSGLQIFRVKQHFGETVTKSYWAKTGAEAAAAGYKYAQTILNGKDRWLTGVSVHGQYWDPGAPVNLSVCETKENGEPDMTNVLATTQIAGAAMVPDIFYKINVKPTFLAQGKVYAYVVWGVGANRIGIGDGSVVVPGNFFAKGAGNTWQVDLSKSLVLDLWYAEFANTRTEIELGDLSLLGGIASVEFQAPAIVPAGASLVLEAQVAGIYRPLTADNPASPFSALPTSTKIRAVLQGGVFNQPGFELPNSVLRASRPAPNMKHYSLPRTVATPSKNFRFREKIEHYHPTKHAVSMKIEVGGTEYAATSASDRAIDNTNLNDQTIERTWLFSLANAASTFRRVTVATTSDVNDLPVIPLTKDVVLS